MATTQLAFVLCWLSLLCDNAHHALAEAHDYIDLLESGSDDAEYGYPSFVFDNEEKNYDEASLQTDLDVAGCRAVCQSGIVTPDCSRYCHAGSHWAGYCQRFTVEQMLANAGGHANWYAVCALCGYPQCQSTTTTSPTTNVPTAQPTAKPTTGDPTRRPTTSPTLKLVCRETTPEDVVLVMDGSGSVGTNGWQIQQSFVTDIINNDITAYTKVCIMQFSDSPSIGVPFTLANTDAQKRNIISAVHQHMQYDIHGSTYIYQALQTAMAQFTAAGSSPNVPKFIIFVTDGNGNGSNDNIHDICGLKAQLDAQSIRLIVVRIRLPSDPTFHNLFPCLLRFPSDYIEINNWIALDHVRKTVKQKLCVPSVCIAGF